MPALKIIAIPITEAAEQPCFCMQPEKPTQSKGFEFTDLDGKKIALEDYKGRVVLIHFWATWCPACTSEIPALNALREKFKHSGLVIIAIAEDSQKKVEPFVKNLDMKYPIIIDQQRELMRSYHIRALPYSILINKNGNINCMATGARDWTLNSVGEYINNLLKEE